MAEAKATTKSAAAAPPAEGTSDVETGFRPRVGDEVTPEMVAEKRAEVDQKMKEAKEDKDPNRALEAANEASYALKDLAAQASQATRNATLETAAERRAVNMGGSVGGGVVLTSPNEELRGKPPAGAVVPPRHSDSGDWEVA